MKQFLEENWQILFNLASLVATMAVVWSLFIKTEPDVSFALMLVIFNLALMGLSGALHRLMSILKS